MATAQIQSLLRFLSQDAKVPLASAMAKVMDLQKANLTSVEQVSKAELKALQEIFGDVKLAKQVLNAGKRVSKKRQAPTGNAESPRKKTKGPALRETLSPFEVECGLALPTSSASDDELSQVAVLTNRAPLVLAFAVCALKYTMPEQPISSRLSLAQAVVSANSRSQAISLGIESGKNAEQEGWGEGQPVIKVLGREIKVLKRWDYDPREGKPTEELGPENGGEAAPSLNDVIGMRGSDTLGSSPPLWGIDLEAMRTSQSNVSRGAAKTDSNLPIFTPNSARSYLFKSFTAATTEGDKIPGTGKRKTVAQVEGEKEACLGHLLRAIDSVCQSWASTLSREELDRRAWAWYLRVRPDVQSGPGGWGEKGHVRLSDILELRREP
ncbi:uncharacterized protein ACLA_038340 [Aspergillus clavatus NRRL 1]|uniref:Impact N-terminal domain-containing protein n=1 Tax=Aspergillus clavatus (strain ATCC 1007 / CBS 513.65 / DSM 816 / NCTC 3887 / NRRL 1 / QM 1276 / 107) TaxID=344612 RepID=A1CKE9_ASPCL|nr:uncharacterized protein ACLA_038340 [Aspergillus clavatus NRRL 1]EAW09623.1 conserved hypothetical protein [Aspergillus clavatus NRRL 1]